MNPADKVQKWAIDKLIPYARNARTHSDEQISQIAASIKEWGWTTPVLVDENGGIIAGHGRTLAAPRLKMTKVPVMVARDWSDAKKRAYVIADNKLAMNAGWDNEMLALEMGELAELGFDLDLTGFTPDEIDALTPVEVTEGLTDPDDAPPLPETPRTRLGDIWVMGKHRLLCGDSTSMDALDALMDGQQADMIFTDPPYGMSYDGGRGKKQFGMIKNDDAKGEDLIALVRDALATAKASCKEGASAYVCFPWRTYAEFEDAMKSSGMDINSCIVWDKKSIGLGHQDYRPQHEFIFYSKGGQFYGDRSQSDVWYMSRGSTGAYVHPTQKPVLLCEDLIKTYSNKGDLVLDFTIGSGTTAIACIRTNRNYIGIELSEEYVKIAKERIQKELSQSKLNYGNDGIPPKPKDLGILPNFI
jgi:DNA modification methylase